MPKPETRNDGYLWGLLAFGVLAVFASASVIFALSQTVWIDETTQLFGLSLPVDELFRWLSGAGADYGGVPPDRNPPLSYLAGKIWTFFSGQPDELLLRISGIVAFAAGAPAVWMAARRLAPPPGALFALALVFLSPAMITQAVEIRPYPLFFCFSCWALWGYARIVTSASHTRMDIVLLTVFLLAASYTHFFGVVLAFAIYASLLVFSLARRLPVWPVMICGVLFLLCCAGLIPFILGGVNVSTETIAPGLVSVLADTVRLAYRLVFHGVHLALGTPVLLLVAAALALLAAFAVGVAWKTGKLFVLVPLVVAFAVLPVAALIIAQFKPLAPHYNLWLVPAAAIFLASAFGARRRLVVWTAAAVLVASHLVATALLLQQPERWTHGPGEWLVSQIEDPAETLVVHDGSSPDWGQPYFPVHYLTSGAVTQLLRTAEGDQWIGPDGLQPLPAGFSEENYDTVLLVRSRALTSEVLARLPEGADCGISPMMPSPAEAASRRWEELHRCAFAGAAVMLGRRASAP